VEIIKRDALLLFSAGLTLFLSFPSFRFRLLRWRMKTAELTNITVIVVLFDDYAPTRLVSLYPSSAGETQPDV